MKFNGEIDVLLKALGKYEGSKEVLDSICIISSDFEIDFLSESNFEHMYYYFIKNGVDFLFNKNENGFVLESIFIYVQENDFYKSYLFFDKLINGVDSKFRKSEMISQFGQPNSEADNWIKYNLDSKFIHFEFNDYGISQISLFVE
ncbi:hypothetical protein V6W59_08970 [Mannheimia sp. HC-2023]|uniref:hypothetical protein n=1 Tax=Mannheimia indoligenes TaxID=3103145 RepID=UPI002FE612A1